MKSVLISIKPQWCELIASGKKTVEVRKTKPKLETPFKVYIYETQGRTETPFVDEEGHTIFKGRGQVIGEFVCDSIYPFHYDLSNGFYEPREFLWGSRLSLEQLKDYVGGSIGYSWHITDLVIYDKPKALSEFKRCCDGNCQSCQYSIWQTSGLAYEPYIVDCKPITRPPQSWFYIEEVEA